MELPPRHDRWESGRNRVVVDAGPEEAELVLRGAVERREAGEVSPDLQLAHRGRDIQRPFKKQPVRDLVREELLHALDAECLEETLLLRAGVWNVGHAAGDVLPGLRRLRVRCWNDGRLDH